MYIIHFIESAHGWFKTLRGFKLIMRILTLSETLATRGITLESIEQIAKVEAQEIVRSDTFKEHLENKLNGLGVAEVERFLKKQDLIKRARWFYENQYIKYIIDWAESTADIWAQAREFSGEIFTAYKKRKRGEPLCVLEKMLIV